MPWLKHGRTSTPNKTTVSMPRDSTSFTSASVAMLNFIFSNTGYAVAASTAAPLAALASAAASVGRPLMIGCSSSTESSQVLG